MNLYKEIVSLLQDRCETISFMESCTGGFLANAVTSIPSASSVFHFGAVTYSSDFKIKMGVGKNFIDTYTVYSMEVAKEMARCVSSFSSSTYGVGVTGKLGEPDAANPFGKDNMVYISIYDSKKDTYLEQTMTMEIEDRGLQKEKIATLVGTIFLRYLKK